MKITESMFTQDTQDALQAARDALKADPLNDFTRMVALASGGEVMDLDLVVVLGDMTVDEEDEDEDPERGTPATQPVSRPNKGDYGPPASEIRQKAKDAGFDLGDRSLRSRADKERALVDIENFLAQPTDPPADEPETPEDDPDELLDDGNEGRIDEDDEPEAPETPADDGDDENLDDLVEQVLVNED